MISPQLKAESIVRCFDFQRLESLTPLDSLYTRQNQKGHGWMNRVLLFTHQLRH